jgi:acetoin utilization deacetylase AcuC-like enzyme
VVGGAGPCGEAHQGVGGGRAGRVAGVDAYKDDPISFFKLDSPDFTDCGQRIGRIGLPTVFCMEGGYAIEQVGVNTVNVLEGFQNA